MIINHNMNAMNAHRNMTANTATAGKAMEKLSSGLRINRAGDDAAGLAISEKMRGQIRGLDQASRNGQDGISLIQTAEGALNETHSILQRMRELAVQSANDTNNTTDRGAIQDEINQLREEIDRIANTTEFNTKKLLTGDLGISVTDGTKLSNVSKTVDTLKGTLTIGGANATALATAATSGSIATTATGLMNAAGTLTINGATLSVTTATKVSDVADWVNNHVTGVKATYDDTAHTIKFDTAAVGADAKLDLETSVDNLFGAADTFTTALAANGTDANLTGVTFTDSKGAAANVAIKGNTVTIATGAQKGLSFDIDKLAINGEKITVGGDASIHIGANEGQTMSVSIDAMGVSALGVQDVDLRTVEGAESAITTIQSAIETVSAQRSKLGAYQNRLEHTIANLNTSSENLQSSESRIRDVDMAKEMMNYSKTNILSQAAQAMLAQANQQPQGVLQLLR